MYIRRVSIGATLVTWATSYRRHPCPCRPAAGLRLRRRRQAPAVTTAWEDLVRWRRRRQHCPCGGAGFEALVEFSASLDAGGKILHRRPLPADRFDAGSNGTTDDLLDGLGQALSGGFQALQGRHGRDTIGAVEGGGDGEEEDGEREETTLRHALLCLYP